MMEAEWMACAEPEPMLSAVRGRLDKRKVQLFGCAFCRRVWVMLDDKRSRLATIRLEEYADDPWNEKLRRDAYNVANPAYIDANLARRPTWPAACAVVCAADLTADPALHFPTLLGNTTAALEHSERLGFSDVRRMAAGWLRDIFGNPFRPAVFDPKWVTPAVASLARSIYADRALGRMPELGDALAATGCTDADVLAHCRGPGPHVRGCWVVDLILGKA